MHVVPREVELARKRAAATIEKNLSRTGTWTNGRTLQEGHVELEQRLDKYIERGKSTIVNPCTANIIVGSVLRGSIVFIIKESP